MNMKLCTVQISTASTSCTTKSCNLQLSNDLRAAWLLVSSRSRLVSPQPRRGTGHSSSPRCKGATVSDWSVYSRYNLDWEKSCVLHVGSFQPTMSSRLACLFALKAYHVHVHIITEISANTYTQKRCHKHKTISLPKCCSWCQLSHSAKTQLQKLSRTRRFTGD